MSRRRHGARRASCVCQRASFFSKLSGRLPRSFQTDTYDSIRVLASDGIAVYVSRRPVHEELRHPHRQGKNGADFKFQRNSNFWCASPRCPSVTTVLARHARCDRYKRVRGVETGGRGVCGTSYLAGFLPWRDLRSQSGTGRALSLSHTHARARALTRTDIVIGSNNRTRRCWRRLRLGVWGGGSRWRTRRVVPPVRM